MYVSHYDVVILGGGAAGLTLALDLPKGVKIAVVSKHGIGDTASYKAQGGIAAVVDETDRFQYHIDDTINAGGSLCNLHAVEFFVKKAPLAIQCLINHGVEFDQTKSRNYDLHREGGHSKRRVLHVRDETGRHIVKKLFQNVQETPNIDWVQDSIAIDLLICGDECTGCLVFDKIHGKVNAMIAKTIVLATGGSSAVYDKTSHPMATGDGIAMAARVGCHIEHMEFCQFHPTCFRAHHGIFLITEALRGEGGHLTLPETGERFMFKYDNRGELAPRDIVARAMAMEMKKHHLSYINLDISYKPSCFIKAHFPKIYHICLHHDVDITSEPIPVFPAAHYTCGGIAVDLFGQTNLKRLFSIGEVAYTGFHGANRLASNSLLECIVSALSAAKKIQHLLPNLKLDHSKLPDQSHRDSKITVPIAKWHRSIQKIMWSNVGIVRNDRLLLAAKTKLLAIKAEIERIFPFAKLTTELIEVRNLAEVASLIVKSAIRRKENYGAHYNLNHVQ